MTGGERTSSSTTATTTIENVNTALCVATNHICQVFQHTRRRLQQQHRDGDEVLDDDDNSWDDYTMMQDDELRDDSASTDGAMSTYVHPTSSLRPSSITQYNEDSKHRSQNLRQGIRITETARSLLSSIASSMIDRPLPPPASSSKTKNSSTSNILLSKVTKTISTYRTRQRQQQEDDLGNRGFVNME